MADAGGGTDRGRARTLPIEDAVAGIAERHPRLPVATIERALWRGIWRGTFDDSGLWLVELDKARPYTRRMLAWQLAQLGVGDDRLGDIGYQAPPRDQDGLPDLGKVEADWGKLAAWPRDAHDLLDEAFREVVVDRLEVSRDALWRWWVDEGERLVGRRGGDTTEPTPDAKRGKPKRPAAGNALPYPDRDDIIAEVVEKYRPCGPPKIKKVIVSDLRDGWVRRNGKKPIDDSTLDRWATRVRERLKS
jgi:hypothetical protein